MAKTTREDDNLVLTWIKLRTIGKTSEQIAQVFGTTQEWVRAATNRVLKEDIKQCGPQVAKYYWSRKSGPKK